MPAARRIPRLASDKVRVALQHRDVRGRVPLDMTIAISGVGLRAEPVVGHPGAVLTGDFDAFYGQAAGGLVAQLYLMTGNREEAADVVQEAFTRAWERWDRLSTYDDPAAWVRTVAWRLAVSRWRRARNSVAAWRRHGGREELEPVGPDTVALVDALRRLPAHHRQAIVLFYIGDLTMAQIADETGVSINTVKSWLSRGRAALGPLLAVDPEPDDDAAPARKEGSRG